MSCVDNNWQKPLGLENSAALLYPRNMQSVINHFFTLGSLCKNFCIILLGVSAFIFTLPIECHDKVALLGTVFILAIFFW